MRKIAAKYIFTGKAVLKNAAVEVNDDGTILNIKQDVDNIDKEPSLEYYNGVIVPGFVNAHCHLELSHMKSAIKSETVDGLPGFIDEIISKRDFPNDLQEKIFKADREMRRNGIIAVGDISNTDDTYKVKSESDIYYHTFIEVFAISNEASDEIFNNAKINYGKCDEGGINKSIVPHAAYSVPLALRKKIIDFNKSRNEILSVHNQETPSENEMIQHKTGKLAHVLKKKGFMFDDFVFNTETALQTNLSVIKKEDNVLLIHNTFSTEGDIDFAENFSKNIYWVFCPLSNQYIEKALPDAKLFLKKDVKVCIGTDSYASNTRLSILDEIKELQQNFPEIPFEKYIEWACLNGAKALKKENDFGSIEPGKRPGLNLVTNFNLKNLKLSEKSKIKVLI